MGPAVLWQLILPSHAVSGSPGRVSAEPSRLPLIGVIQLCSRSMVMCGMGPFPLLAKPVEMSKQVPVF